MKHNVILSAVAMLFSASLLSAQTVDFDRGGFNIKEALKNAPVTAPAASTAVSLPSQNDVARVGQPAEWTIMVFVNGKNNLEKYALRDGNDRLHR